VKKTIVLALAAAACFGLLLACPTEKNEKEDNPGNTVEYTVTFNKNDADVVGASDLDPASKKVKSGEEVGELPTLTSTSHTFSGWFTTRTGGTKYETTTTVSADITLNARWTRIDDGKVLVKVGTAAQLVEVTASSGKVNVLSGGRGYEFVSNGYGTYAWFKVNLGTGKKLGNVVEVTFDYEAVQGDVGYKTLYLLASDSTFQSNLGSSDAYKALAVSGFRFWQESGDKSVNCVIGEVETDAAPEIVSNNVAKSNASEVYVCLYMHAAATGDRVEVGSATTFSVSNIVFVTAPDYLAVEGINGVPDAGQINTEVDLTTATVTPSAATNKTIVWSVKSVGTTTGVTVGPLATGKFTPTAVGTVTVTATVANGETATTPFSRDYEIAIRTAPTERQIPLTEMSGAVTGTLDADGFGFEVTGGADYEWKAATFTLDLGTATLKDVVKVTFDYTPVDGDTNYKPILFVATDIDGVLSGPFTSPENGWLGAVATGPTSPGAPTSLEITLNYTLAKDIDGSEVQVGFVVSADSTAHFTIDNIRFWVAE
jgi:hypothetical protein